jgi:predicted RNA-binding Zn-ribbon protein involved in translation (DUF1610 family)
VRARHADTYDMTAIPVECLRCGKRHQIMRASRSTIHEGECPRCGYVGWTPARAAMRRLLAPARARLVA